MDCKTGEVLVAAKVDDGRRVVRRKLRDLFRRGIDVRFGYKLAGVDTSGEGVTATFENGEVVRVDVLVGADGGELRLAGPGYGGWLTCGSEEYCERSPRGWRCQGAGSGPVDFYGV